MRVGEHGLHDNGVADQMTADAQARADAANPSVAGSRVDLLQPDQNPSNPNSLDGGDEDRVASGSLP